ncbi:MAG: hypothetical protein QXK78_03095 [Candidatus Bathyarchaeia archaeon]
MEREKMKTPKILAITALIMALIVILITAAKQVAASTPPNNPGNIIDDILYLRRSPNDNNLTRESPTSSAAASITVSGGSSRTVMWINGTPVPNGSSWKIDGGKYNFTFWMNATHRDIAANVTFTFGYINASGQQGGIVSGTMTGISPGEGSAKRYNITIHKSEVVYLTSDSKLFLKVQISVSGPPGQKAFFWYDGASQPTQIITPEISLVVPEFSLGVVFLPSALLLAHLILRKHSVRFRV